jgi:adenine-specific DNA-methyltransferase
VTELSFKGKEFVYNHHLAVPFRPLVPDVKKSIGPVALDGNLIIHGDNLHALKALLPLYAGEVDCIYIDPPYNTGNEGWSYNDNVNSPMIREWLNDNPIGIEDGLRHDKWCAMMWPRLRLLRELMADDGVFFASIDDNEGHSLRALCNEIFGQHNYVATFIWRKVDSPNDNKVAITPDHEYVLCYCKDIQQVNFGRLVAPSILDAYPHRADDGRLYRDRLLKKNGRNSLRRDRPTMWFPVEDPDGNEVYPIHDNGEEACWAMGKEGVKHHQLAGTLVWKRRQKLGKEVWEPYTREFAPVDPTRPYPTIWNDLPTMRQAKAMLRDMFGTADLFATPKPVELIERIISLLNRDDALFLDSFGGSGTTAHAVLRANARDNGTRQVILVETEDYADTLTAERVRRAISGYESTKGLGGTFTYCTLGAPVELDKVLTGETLPSFTGIGAALFHMATSRALDPKQVREADFYLGEANGQHVWLIYKPDLDWLKTPEAALTLSRARAFAESDPKKRHLVFAPARYVSQKMLAEQNIPVEFVPLPFALYRIDRS